MNSRTEPSGPARAGFFIYAKDVEHLAGFYEALAGMRRLRNDSELVVLQSADMQLLIHALPAAIAENIHIASPPVRRADTALKFFFTVPGLAWARETAASLGGTVLQEQYQGPGFIVCNAMDPEGNVFQVRESLV